MGVGSTNAISKPYTYYYERYILFISAFKHYLPGHCRWFKASNDIIIARWLIYFKEKFRVVEFGKN